LIGLLNQPAVIGDHMLVGIDVEHLLIPLVRHDHRLLRDREEDGLPRPPHRQQLASKRSDHGVIHAGLNLAIVYQEVVGQMLQLPQVFVPADDRFFAEIAARHHQRLESVEQQVM